jgi:hypothetical protein
MNTLRRRIQRLEQRLVPMQQQIIRVIVMPAGMAERESCRHVEERTTYDAGGTGTAGGTGPRIIVVDLCQDTPVIDGGGE